MRRLCSCARSVLTGLVLGLLLVALAAEPHPATAQQSTFNPDQPVQSLEQAVVNAESDSKLVALATALQKARADTKISHQEYRDGVQVFRQHHPGFYGNFFGDPFYATYDARYMRLALERQLAEPDINPQNSFKTNDWFFCAPFTYDPAFGGRCRGFTFAVADFFILPFGPAFGRQELASRRTRVPERLARRGVAPRTRSMGSISSEPDTSRPPIADVPTPERPESGRPAPDEIEATDLAGADVDLAPTPDKISVPDAIAPPERTVEPEARTAPDHVKTVSRVRALVRRKQDGDRLSAEERQEVISALQRTAERQTAVRTRFTEQSHRLPQRADARMDRNVGSPHRPSRSSPGAIRPQVDRVGVDRSASPTARRDRSDAMSERSSGRDRSDSDDSSDGGTRN